MMKLFPVFYSGLKVAKLFKLFADKMLVKKSSFATATRYRRQAFSMMNFFGLFLQLCYAYRVRLFYVFLGINVTMSWVIQCDKVTFLYFVKRK